MTMQAQDSSETIKLNLGCGGRPLSGYINIDKDSLERMKTRYPTQEFSNDIEIHNYDIFNLPFEDATVDEVNTDSLLEHLSFLEEREIFREVKRVLRPEGLFKFSVPDFEETVKLWLAAKDEWKDFYRNDEEAIAQKHWFGQYSYSAESRWGYLTATIFGPQNAEGQFHKNCYTIPKIQAILRHLEFREGEISKFPWKGYDALVMLQVKAYKKSDSELTK